ncbi:hypothetical protein [Hymenobacter radiodurans]|uniref:hypothetical protein n=1 Tax=Hymenobacter radiodurans TaxID=2496028 RepID=UPI0010589ADC|nr:hypothetical protein [Hymenobacter radiodurans]
MTSKIYSISLISSILIALATAITLFYAKREVGKLEQTVLAVSKELSKEVEKRKVLDFYSSITLPDSTRVYLIRENLLCLQTADYYTDKIHKEFGKDAHEAFDILSKTTPYEFNSDKLMVNYVYNKLILHDPRRLCRYCYIKHQNRFEFIVDSIRRTR